jgi:uncharacterized integral membrane protein (TIGR00698 family)
MISAYLLYIWPEHTLPGMLTPVRSRALTRVLTRAAARGRAADFVGRVGAGVGLAAAVAALAYALQQAETRWLGHPVLEGLVLAILIGMVVRTAWTPPARVEPGVAFAAKEVLEVAIVLLGASVSLPMLLREGPALLAGIAGTVVVAIVAGALLGRALGLETKHAVLVACGNAICGNSAIAAIAPVIHARKEHVASAIAFTAILGVVVILALPSLIPPLHLTVYQYGVLAGMTVYAVPQVLAAAFPVSPVSGEVGTLVKLVRVLLLGPVVLALALLVRGRRRRASAAAQAADHAGAPGRTQTLGDFLPWFIVGFLVLATVRSAGLLDDALALQLRTLSQLLTTLAMAGLGLGVDLRALRRVGLPVVATVTGSLVVIVALSAIVVKAVVHL